jgi:hypothetical protein
MKKITFFLFSLSIQLLYSGNLIHSKASKKPSPNHSILSLLINGVVNAMAIPSIFPPENNKKNDLREQIKKTKRTKSKKKQKYIRN